MQLVLLVVIKADLQTDEKPFMYTDIHFYVGEKNVTMIFSGGHNILTISSKKVQANLKSIILIK